MQDLYWEKVQSIHQTVWENEEHRVWGISLLQHMAFWEPEKT